MEMGLGWPVGELEWRPQAPPRFLFLVVTAVSKSVDVFQKRRHNGYSRAEPCRAKQRGVMSTPLSQGNVFRPEWGHGANPEKVPCNSSMSMIRIAIYLDRSKWKETLQD